MDANLKETFPHKYYFQQICKIMYFIGMKDFWYENPKKPEYINKAYTLWQILIHSFTFIVYFNELLAYSRTDLSEKEKDVRFLLCLGQTIIFSKMFVLYTRRDQIMVLMQRLVEGTRTLFTSLELEHASMKRMVKSMIILTSVAYFTLVSAFVEAVIIHLKEGLPITIAIVYYPRQTDTGILVNTIRFLIEYQWYHIVMILLSQDSIIICSLCTFKSKFEIIRLYFENLQTKLVENRDKKSLKQLDEEFKNDFMMGIKMHESALWCVTNVQASMGPIYSIQVLQSVTLLVICLVKLVTAEHDMAYLVYNFAYLSYLILITGSYMLTAGDISHEASLLPTSIFHCGWELTRARADLRTLAVVALQRSQAPVTLTAFGVVELSYTNFISVLRSSYSFFAVVY